MSSTLQAPALTLTRAEGEAIFADWFAAFVSAIERGSADDFAGLFTEHATWRDFMAFDWNFMNRIGRDEFAAEFLQKVDEWGAEGFTINTEQSPVLVDGYLYCFFDFTTKDRIARGFISLVPSGDGWAAGIFSTQIIGLVEYPEATRSRRKQGKVHGYVPGRTRWLEDRAAEAEFLEEDPTVLILGAGHNGLSVAARLGALGVPTLVFDKEDRVGDQWRKRYPSLALHSVVFGDQMPYFEWPDTWTSHTPKDKLADWFESYAHLLDINVWTRTQLVKARFDEAEQRWTVFLRRGDNSIRELRPRHFIIAGGLFGSPKIPDIPGLDTFPGLWTHSDSYQDGLDVVGKRVLVVGAGVSGHELAHDLYEHDADVTILQRSSTWVVSFDTNNARWSPLFTEDMPIPKDFADQVVFSTPNVINDEIGRELVRLAEEDDRELIAALEKIGFKIKRGPDVTGVPGAHMAGKDAYQIDIGASWLVAQEKIHLKQGVEVAEIDGSTVIFTDGSREDYDFIIFATGYYQFWDHIKPSLGDIADKIDHAYGRDVDGEYKNTWRRSAQPGLWFATGFIRMVRLYSTFIALQIKAIEEGIEPFDPENPSGPPQD